MADLWCIGNANIANVGHILAHSVCDLRQISSHIISQLLRASSLLL